MVLFLGSLICSMGFVSVCPPKPHFLNMENSKVNVLNMLMDEWSDGWMDE